MVGKGGEKRTIYWADCILRPPKMEAATVNFKNMEYEQGGTRYVEYIAPLQKSRYDVNKTPDRNLPRMPICVSLPLLLIHFTGGWIRIRLGYRPVSGSISGSAEGRGNGTGRGRLRDSMTVKMRGL